MIERPIPEDLGRFAHVIAAWRNDLQDMESWPFRTVYGLTEGQSMALGFIKSFIASHGHAPSYDEIRDGIGQKSKAGVARLLNGLKERGYIRTRPHSARSIEVL